MKKIIFLSTKITVFLTIFLCAGLIAGRSFAPYQAMVAVPVAEAIGFSIGQVGYKGDIQAYYNRMPLAAVDYRDGSCPRLHQLLSHEIVTVEAEEGEEVKVVLGSTYYQLKNDEEKRSSFWTLKKNIIPLSAIDADLSCVPQPICYEKGRQLKDLGERSVVILAPFNDSVTGQYFSAGTQFALVDGKVPRFARQYDVYVYDPASKRFVTTTIPSSLALLNRRRTHQESVQLFVRIVRIWAHNSDGVIPYVWGGNSFVHLDPNGVLQETTEQVGGKQRRYYVRQGYDHVPKTGCDCSGMILRAAQIAGLPYYFKNTTTIEKNLKPLTPKQTLAEGDIIFFPGHVMVVTDVQKNLCVEARGYASGYGKIHETSLDTIFLEAKNYDDLVSAYYKGAPLTLLNRAGERYMQVPFIKLLRLKSVWE